MLWAGHTFAARSCCDLDLQGIDSNAVCNMSSLHCDHFCEIVVKSNFKYLSYGADTILLQGHVVTLTFTEATQILLATRCLNMVIIYVK